MHRTALVLALLGLAVSACTGDKGDPGDPGDKGDKGDTGDPGPIGAPPILTGLSPAWGSALTEVTITGESFSTTAADNRVTFDGVDATVISATATELVVQPSIATDDAAFVVVNVEVANQVSNGLVFELVASGTSRALSAPMPTAPTSVAGVGTDLYIAAGGLFSSASGLYRRSASGATTRLVSGRAFPNLGGGGPTTVYDGPISLATDGTNVYYVTTFGSVRRYKVSDGSIEELIGPALGGDAFPRRIGLTVDSGGYVYVLDLDINGDQAGTNSGVVRLDPDGSAAGIAGSALAPTAITTDGTTLFIAYENGAVVKVADPQSAATATPHATGINAPAHGLAVVGTELVGSGDDGLLYSTTVASGGAVAVWGDASGYGYAAEGLWANSGGDLYLAQSLSSAVREIADGETDSTVVAAGARIAFATARIGDTWYFATVGQGLFDSGPGGAPAAPDGVLLQLNPDGSSEVLATGGLLIGAIATGASELTVSDCVAGEIFTVDTGTGTPTTVLDSGDGLVCPAGLANNSAGDLFYVNTDFGSSNPSTIGRLPAGGSANGSFATGLPPASLYLTLAGDTLLSAGIGIAGSASPIYSASATASGTASELVPAAAASGATGLATSPSGRVFMHRFALGDLLEIDPGDGTVSPVGSTLIPGMFVFGDGGTGSATFSIGFEDDDTAVMLDFGQGALIATAP